MWFLFKNMSWQSRKKNTLICLHISWLTFLTSLFTLPSKVILHQFSQILKKFIKEAEGILLNLVSKNRSERYLQTVVGSTHGPLGSHSSSGGWDSLGSVWRFLSLFHPSTTPFNVFLLLCFLSPFLSRAMIHLPGFRILILFPSPRQARPQNKTFSRPHLISASPHPLFLASPPSFFAKSTCPHPSVPSDIPQSLGQLPTSPDSRYSFHYSVSLSAPFLST